MNEGTGGKVYDLAGNGNHGTLQEDTHWVPGQYGPCLGFDGDGDYVNVGDTSSINNITVPFSISAWIKPVSGNSGVIFSSDDQDSTTGNFYGFRVKLVDSGVRIRYGDGTGAGDENIRSGRPYWSPITDNVWTHIVGVVEGATDMSIYTNSDLNPTMVYKGTGGDMVHSAYAAKIGISSLWGVTYFNGSIDNVMIYDRTLSAEEVKALYADPFHALRYPCPVELFTYVESVAEVTVFPDALSLTVTLHQAGVASSPVVSPSALATTASLEAPSVSVSATQEVSALSLDATLQEVVVRADVTVEPMALSASTSLPAPQVNYDCGVAVDASGLSSALPTPTVETGQGAQVSAEALSLGAAVHAPDLGYDIQQTVSAVTLTSTVHGPEVAAGTIVPVGSQSMTAAVQAPGVTYDCQFAVDALGFAVSLEPAVTSYTCSVTPTSLPLTAAVETPVVLYGTIVQAAVQQVQSAIGSVHVAYDFGQSVSVVAMTTQLPSIAVTADMVLDAETQSLHGTVIEPAISTALFQVAWALNLWEK
ncbi:MAG: LamG domain-containing protein [Deltaproteobacteria bacterium]|nr:LamG domain-containing protein [Deltaproteobacteria bacterium]